MRGTRLLYPFGMLNSNMTTINNLSPRSNSSGRSLLGHNGELGPAKSSTSFLSFQSFSNLTTCIVSRAI